MLTARFLCSTNVNPLHNYDKPIRHLLAFDTLPAVHSYSIYLATRNFFLGRGRFLQLLCMSFLPCYRYHPAGVYIRSGQISNFPCCLRSTVASSNRFQSHLCAHSRHIPATRSPLDELRSIPINTWKFVCKSSRFENIAVFSLI